MATLPQYDNIEFSVTSSADIAAHLRVKLNASAEIEVSGDEPYIGSLTERGAESGFSATVRSCVAPTSVMVANGAIAAGGPVNTAAAGKVTTGVGAVFIGEALTSAAADNDLILVARSKN